MEPMNDYNPETGRFEPPMNINKELIEAYYLVIADLAQDIGYEPGVQEATLSVLKNREWEILNVWSK